MNTRAVGRTTAAIAVVVIVIIAAVGIYFVTQPSTPSMTSSSTTGQPSTSGAPQTLTIDDAFWPSGDLNQLSALGEIPYPNWAANTVYQPLTTLNGSLLYRLGIFRLFQFLRLVGLFHRTGPRTPLIYGRM